MRSISATRSVRMSARPRFSTVALDQKLGPAADKLNYVFVTIDPDRDTPQVLHTYLSSFDKHIRGFTGTPEQIATDRARLSRLLQKISGRRRQLYDGPLFHRLSDGRGRKVRKHDSVPGTRRLRTREA